MSPERTVREPVRKRRWLDELFRIRSKLLLVNAFLVVVPLAGLTFARYYERELLRSEEEGMRALAGALADTIAYDIAHGRSLADPGPIAGASAAARVLGAQIRVIDPNGRAVADTGAEVLEVVTRGRSLVEAASRSSYAPPRVTVADPPPSGASFTSRPEVAQALAGTAGRATRIATGVRGVRLYLTEPIKLDTGTVAGAVYVSRTTYPVLVSLYRVRNGLFRVAAGSLVVALALALFLALTISRPLRKLTIAARRIANGERGVKLKLSGRDEVADLARAFDDMAHELDARLAYISELAANVSHEFKTPIASIRGAAELLRDGAAEDPGARARFLGNILGDSERLTALVSRLLELSRIESAREPAVPFDYRALVEDVVARYRASSQRDIVLDYNARHAHLSGSAEQLDSVLGNLLDNALRFSPADSTVTVRVARGDGDTLRTEVSDRGRGLSEANQARVWDRFFTTARGEGGTGLGLSIVRAVVESHGGRVGLESTEGQGTVFWFVLPRRL